jgi:hypothetical protein
MGYYSNTKMTSVHMLDTDEPLKHIKLKNPVTKCHILYHGTYTKCLQEKSMQQRISGCWLMESWGEKRDDS